MADSKPTSTLVGNCKIIAAYCKLIFAFEALSIIFYIHTLAYGSYQSHTYIDGTIFLRVISTKVVYVKEMIGIRKILKATLRAINT